MIIVVFIKQKISLCYLQICKYFSCKLFSISVSNYIFLCVFADDLGSQHFTQGEYTSSQSEGRLTRNQIDWSEFLGVNIFY